MKKNKDLIKALQPTDTQRYLNERIRKLLKSKNFDAQRKEFYLLKKEVVKSSISGGSENNRLYDIFKTIVAKEDYFRLEHIDKLGLEYDILLFLSKKGIGKSYFMINQINEWTSDGESIAVVFRLTDEDLPAFDQQIRDYGGHFTMASKGDLISTTQFEPDPKNPKKMIPRYIGRACGMTTAAKMKGGGYRNLKGIIMDEATDVRKGIKKATFETFFRSILNSIERETKKLPFIIFGNTDGNESHHPLFAALGIDPTENLVYVKRQFPGAQNETKILYINSRGLYNKGAHTSKMIGAIADPHQVLAAFVNESVFNNNKISSLDLTVLGDPCFGILFKDTDNTKYICKVCVRRIRDPESEEEKEVESYFIGIEKFDLMYTYGFDGRIVTDSSVIEALYQGHVLRFEDVSSYWRLVDQAMRYKYSLLIGAETEELLSKYLERFMKPKKISS